MMTSRILDLCMVQDEFFNEIGWNIEVVKSQFMPPSCPRVNWMSLSTILIRNGVGASCKKETKRITRTHQIFFTDNIL